MSAAGSAQAAPQPDKRSALKGIIWCGRGGLAPHRPLPRLQPKPKTQLGWQGRAP